MADGTIAVEMTSDEHRLWGALEKLKKQNDDLVAKLKAAEGGYNDTGKAGEQAAKRIEKATSAEAKVLWEADRAIQKTKQSWAEQAKAAEGARKQFGSEAVTDLKNYVTGLASVATAAGILKTALSEMNKERLDAAQSISGQEKTRGGLAAIAGNAEEFKRYIAEANKTRLETGMPAVDAQNLQDALVNAKMAEDRQLFAGFHGALPDVAKFARASGKWREGFGERETGGARSIVNKLLVAGGMSADTADEFAVQMTGAASGAAAIGTSDEELAAIGVLVGNASETTSIASSQIKDLAKIIQKKGLGGRGILAGSDALAGMVAQIEASSGLSAADQAARASASSVLADPASVLNPAERAAWQANRGLAMRATEKHQAGGQLSAKEMAAWQKDEGFRERIGSAEETARAKLATLEAKERDSGNVGGRVIEMFGSIEGYQAFLKIQRMRPEILAVQREIDAAGRASPAGDATSLKQSMFMADPQLAALRQRNVAGQRLAVDQEDTLAPRTLKMEAYRYRKAAEDIEAGVPTGDRLAKQFGRWGADYIDLPVPELVRKVHGSQPMNAGIDKMLLGLWGYKEEDRTAQNGSAEKLSQAADRLSSAADKLAAASAGRPALAAPNVDK